MGKLFILCILFGSISLFARGQQTGILNFISEKGEKFSVYLNDKKINEVAYDHVRITDLPNIDYSAKIVFDNPSISPVTKTLQVIDPDYKLMDITYKISVNKSGKGKFKFYSMYPAKDFIVLSRARVFSYNGEMRPPVSNIPVAKKVQDEKTIPQPVIEQKKIIITEEKKITGSAVQPVKEDAKLKTAARKKNVLADSKCKSEWPMWQGDFAKAIKKIPDLTSDPLKLSAAKSVATTNCLSSSQVSELSLLLAGEESRLAFVKYAFLHTTDPGNYSGLEKLFATTRGKDEFNKFINGD